MLLHHPQISAILLSRRLHLPRLCHVGVRLWIDLKPRGRFRRESALHGRLSCAAFSRGIGTWGDQLYRHVLAAAHAGAHRLAKLAALSHLQRRCGGDEHGIRIPLVPRTAVAAENPRIAGWSCGGGATEPLNVNNATWQPTSI